MQKKRLKPLTDKSGEIRGLTREEIRDFKPAAEVLPPKLLAFFKSFGQGWQTRINDALKDIASKD